MSMLFESKESFEQAVKTFGAVEGLKEEFCQQIHNENLVGTPTITIKNEVAEGDCVAVEGSVTSRFKVEMCSMPASITPIAWKTKK